MGCHQSSGLTITDPDRDGVQHQHSDRDQNGHRGGGRETKRVQISGDAATHSSRERTRPESHQRAANKATAHLRTPRSMNRDQ